MKLLLARGATAQTIRLFVQDSSVSTGAGLTGLTAGSAGLTAYYVADGAATTTAITLGAGTVGTWSSGGFVAVDAAHMPGVYELGLPNAALASGNDVLVFVAGATNMVPTLAEIGVVAYNPQDATALGLARLDVAVSTRNAVAPDNADIATILTRTDVATSTRLASGNVTVGGYATGEDPAALLLTTPANKLLTTASGQVQHDMAQAVPTSNTAQTVGDALNAARAEGFGRWTVVGTSLQLYAPDGTTVVHAFALDSATAPTTRS